MENIRAMALRDKGDVEGAKKVLLGNEAYLQKNALELGSDALRKLDAYNRQDRQNLDAADWSAARKQMKDAQYQIQQAQGMEIDKAEGRRAVLPAKEKP